MALTSRQAFNQRTNALLIGLVDQVGKLLRNSVLTTANEVPQIDGEERKRLLGGVNSSRLVPNSSQKYVSSSSRIRSPTSSIAILQARKYWSIEFCSCS